MCACTCLYVCVGASLSFQLSQGATVEDIITPATLAYLVKFPSTLYESLRARSALCDVAGACVSFHLLLYDSALRPRGIDTAETMMLHSENLRTVEENDSSSIMSWSCYVCLRIHCSFVRSFVRPSPPLRSFGDRYINFAALTARRLGKHVGGWVR